MRGPSGVDAETAIHWPSGDHVGAFSKSNVAANGLAPVPSTLPTCKTLRPFCRTPNARRFLSGDNAVVIALACRYLPPRQRKIGVMLGAGVAVALRIIVTMAVVWLMDLPYLKLVGGVLLLGISVKLLTDETEIGSAHV